MRFTQLPGWRTLLAGLLAVAIGLFDLWRYGRAEGLSVELDEALVLIGIALIASGMWRFPDDKDKM